MLFVAGLPSRVALPPFLSGVDDAQPLSGLAEVGGGGTRTAAVSRPVPTGASAARSWGTLQACLRFLLILGYLSSVCIKNPTNGDK